MSPRLNNGGYAIFQYYDPIVYPTKERKFIMDILEDGAIFLSVAKFYRVIYRVYVDEIELMCDNKSCEDECNEVIYSEEEFCGSGMTLSFSNTLSRSLSELKSNLVSLILFHLSKLLI